MYDKLFNKPYKYILIILPIILFIVFLIPLHDAKINPDLTRYLPQDSESKLNLEAIEKQFGKYDPVIIVFEADDILDGKTLTKISQIHDSILESPIYSEVISLFDTKNIRGDDGFMLVDPAIASIPTSKEETEELRKELKSNPLAYKLLVSEDFKYAVMILNPEKGFSDSEVIKATQEIITKNWGKDKYYMTGMLFLRDEIQKKATQDLMILMPLALLIMIIFLFISFKEKRGVLLPVMVVVISTGVSMGLMPMLGYELSIIAVLVPILMISIANNYGVHIISKYQELNALHPEYDMQTIVKESVHNLFKPIMLTGLTTIAGVLGLVVHIMLPAKQMGVVSSIGIAFSLVLSLYFLPAILIGLKKGKVQKSFISTRRSPIDRLLAYAAKLATTKSKAVIITFLIVFVVAGLGIAKLQVSINNENMMPKNHSIRKASNIMNESFGGTKFISVLFEGDIKDPSVIKEMDQLETKLKQHKQVGTVNSLASIIKIMSKALNDPSEEGYNKIPDTREGIAQYIEFYNMSGDPADFEKFVDFDYTKAVLSVQFKAKDIKEFNEVVNEVQVFCNNSKHAKYSAGLSLIEKDMAVSIVRGQVYSLILALGTIIFLLWWIFKSFKTGIAGSIPLIFTLVCNFGLMGWLGIGLDIATSLLSSVAIGIGVDYTIHMFWRIHNELKLGNDIATAITICLKTTGRGIAINAFSVMLGFSVLFFSGIVFLKAFAFLIIFSLLLCLVCALILIPAIMMKTKLKNI